MDNSSKLPEANSQKQFANIVISPIIAITILFSEPHKHCPCRISATKDSNPYQ